MRFAVIHRCSQGSVMRHPVVGSVSPIRASVLLALVGLSTLAGCTTQTWVEPDTALSGVESAPEDPMAAHEAEAQADALLAENPKLLEGVDELEQIGTELDASDMGHVRYRQLHGGVPVFGGEAIVHLTPRGALFGVSDTLVRDIALDSDPSVDAETAATMARASQDTTLALEEAPETELVVLRRDGMDRLTWKVTLRLVGDAGLAALPVVFVDAQAGGVAWSYDDLQDVALQDSEKVTLDNRGSTSSSAAVVGDSSDAELRGTHEAVGATLDFLADTQARDSWDGRGAAVYSYGHYGRSYANAYWDGRRLVFGDGDGRSSGYMGVLDITAHELGHALTDAEAALIYEGESGALNEAASDMLAAAVEARVDGGTGQDTWDIGEDTWRDGRALRYMQAPSADGSSRSHYASRFTGFGDNGGVHINSGIANHWFYLLSEGGRHHDSRVRSGIVVPGIGIEAAYDIWYTALSRYMTRRTDFAGARQATEAACEASGYPVATCDAVSAAWFEVGVGGEPPQRSDQSGGGSSSSGGSGGSSSGGSSSGGVCPSGWGVVEGTVASGRDARFPYSVGGGDQRFLLVGPSGADLDLYVYRQDSSGQYQTLGSSTSSSSQEQVELSSSGGDHLVQVRSYSGGGDFTLCYDL
jgi:Zn-dependent metalloprotease